MKICLISLGCDKNLVDSEMMLGFLSHGDVTVTDNEDEADVILINTCAFILDAKDESVRTILECADRKKSGQLRALIVTGCLAERYKADILKEIPEVDAVVGTTAYDSIAEVLKRVLAGEKVQKFEELNRLPAVSERRVLSTLTKTGYLKIAEGCSKRCTYCAIPFMRGNYRSYPMDLLVAEAERMAEQGIEELILVAQETTVYGIDLYGRKKLPTLLRKLCRVRGIRWIRLLYCYPEEITDDLISCMVKQKKICHYLDLPIQHADDDVLRRMGRRTTGKDLREIVAKLRSAMPDIVLRTTLISGFPGETEENHETLKEFVSEEKFEHLGVFCYSKEEGTSAAKYPDQVPARTKKKRRNEIMALQQKISAECLKKRIGSVMEVLVEGYLPEDGVYEGRTYMDAPEIDGYLFFTAKRELMTGEFVKVRITGASEYDLRGEMI